MKKTFFLFMLIIACMQLKAQTLQLQPFNKLQVQLFKAPGNYYKRYLDKTRDSLKETKPYQQLLNEEAITNQFLNQYAYNPMPIVKMSGYSKMPVVKLEINSKMPVINLDGEIKH